MMQLKIVYTLVHIASGAFMPVQAHPTLGECMTQLEANYDEAVIDWFEYEAECRPIPAAQPLAYGFFHPQAQAPLPEESK